MLREVWVAGAEDGLASVISTRAKFGSSVIRPSTYWHYLQLPPAISAAPGMKASDQEMCFLEV